MTDYPKFVRFGEEGPREGFQIEKTIFPIEQRIELIDRLSETGLKRIQVGSFVSPKYVPQMADTAELLERIKRAPGVEYTALWLNEKGFRSALSAKDVHIDARLFFYASDEFARHNNERSADEIRDSQRDWVKLYRGQGYEVNAAYIMAAFGCNFEGEVPLSKPLDIVRWIKDLAAEASMRMPIVILADTMGWATPDKVKRMIDGVREIAPEAGICMHLHDTRGMGIANFHAALEMGVDYFESSVAGLGGCPFAGHGAARAAGNVCTEDAVFMCHELGIETGIDLEKLSEAARFAEKVIGSNLMGRVMHSGGLDKYR